MRNSPRFDLVRALLSVALLSLPLLAGCTSSPSASSPNVTASPSKCGVARVVPVQGRIATIDGRTVAEIDPFPSTEPPRLGAPIELYVQTFPTEEFDAHVTGVSFKEFGAVTLEANTVHADTRLTDGTLFTGDLVLTDACPSHRESSVRMRRIPLLGET
jgi:hypothetical protein